ncbi:MAG TPA: hypothetical protein DCG57_18245 [Candidatus Riflebacteria bacterium]|nr:hypothetical protein [Candidatus Riflebacteria bacterium]
MSEHYLLPVYQYLTQTLLRLTSLTPAQTDTVDLGGGNGMWLYYMLSYGFKSATLVDADHEKIEAAHNLLAEKFDSSCWQTIQADVAAIPVPDNAFDLAVSRSSLHFWADLPAAWREIARITRPGGYFFSGRGYGPDLPEELRQAVKAAKYQHLCDDSGEKHQEPPSLLPDELSAIAAEVGFTTLAVLPDHKAYWFLAQKNR